MGRLRLEGTSRGHLVQLPAQVGPPQADCLGPSLIAGLRKNHNQLYLIDGSQQAVIVSSELGLNFRKKGVILAEWILWTIYKRIIV